MNRYLVEFAGRENGSEGLERPIVLGIYANDPARIRPIIGESHEYWHIDRVAIVNGGSFERPELVNWTLYAHGEWYDYFRGFDYNNEREFFTWSLPGSVPVNVEGGYYSLNSLVATKNDRIVERVKA